MRINLKAEKHLRLVYILNTTRLKTVDVLTKSKIRIYNQVSSMCDILIKLEE